MQSRYISGCTESFDKLNHSISERHNVLQETLKEKEVESKKLQLKIEELEFVEQKNIEAGLSLLTEANYAQEKEIMEKELKSLRQDFLNLDNKNRQLAVINQEFEKALGNKGEKIAELKANGEVILKKFSNILTKINGVIEINEEEVSETTQFEGGE